MIIAITGANGFIGRHLIQKLISSGHTVHALVRSVESKHLLTSRFGSNNLKVHAGIDITNIESLRSVLDRVDSVVHLASDMDFYPTDVQKMARVNVGGTKNLLDVVIEKKNPNLKFLYISTQEAMGPSKVTLTENSPCKPQYEYGKQKLQAEQLVKSYGEKYGLKHVIFRLTGVTGPEDEYAAFEFLRAISWGIMVCYPGSCMGLNSFVHVDDVTQAIQTILEKDELWKSTGETFIIGPSQSATFKECIDAICDEFGWPRPKFTCPLPVFKFAVMCIEPIYNLFRKGKKSFLFHPITIAAMEENRSYSSEKAMKAFGYTPMSTIEAFQKTIRFNINKGIMKTAKSQLLGYLRVFLIISLLCILVIVFNKN